MSNKPLKNKQYLAFHTIMAINEGLLILAAQKKNKKAFVWRRYQNVTHMSKKETVTEIINNAKKYFYFKSLTELGCSCCDKSPHQTIILDSKSIAEHLLTKNHLSKFQEDFKEFETDLEKEKRKCKEMAVKTFLSCKTSVHLLPQILTSELQASIMKLRKPNRFNFSNVYYLRKKVLKDYEKQPLPEIVKPPFSLIIDKLKSGKKHILAILLCGSFGSFALDYIDLSQLARSHLSSELPDDCHSSEIYLSNRASTKDTKYIKKKQQKQKSKVLKEEEEVFIDTEQILTKNDLSKNIMEIIGRLLNMLLEQHMPKEVKISLKKN